MQHGSVQILWDPVRILWDPVKNPAFSRRSLTRFARAHEGKVMTAARILPDPARILFIF